MKIFNFEIDPNNLTKNQILSGVAVLVVTVTIVFGLFGNSGLFTGNVGDTTNEVPVDGVQVVDGEVVPADTGNEQTPACNEPDATYEGLIESVNQAVEAINEESLNIELVSSKESIVTATEGLLTLVASLPDELTNDCIEIGNTYSLSTEEEELTIFELIDLFNDSADDFNTVKEACTDCTVADITKIETTFACSNSRVFDEEDQTCNNPPPLVCDLQDKYNATATANNLLISFKDKSTTFSATDYATLKTELAKIDNSTTGNIFTAYLTTFDYRTQGEALSTILVTLANTIRASGNPICANLAVLGQLLITPASTPVVLPSDEAPNSNNLINNALNNRVASNANSCPANSTFDSVVQGCYCPLKNKYLSGSEKCEIATGSNLEIPVVTCPNGKTVQNISSCTIVDKEEESDPDFTDDFELPEDLPGTENEEADSEEEDPLGDALVFPDTNTDSTNNSTPPSLGDPTNIAINTPDTLEDIDTSNSLLSNTNANVMRSNSVQGNTGPGLWLALLISFTGSYFWFRKSN